ncbi:hypothetical protein [Snodgrassella alvi]|jgi:DNA repair exonuclease SbcCD ATPase subunit|uniref:Uncharacterized protein n=1 Tax=Snodgrassella alvi TaxID=1196083 RepID=A0A855FQM3_9NEIS|nr:hypothetical protein [Snodgrassella alvi]PIT60780.1 hypothetical protein BHC57_02890 [Snodgrassella alvi]
MDAEIKRIINKVFETTGVKLDRTDPLIAVLLMQYSYFDDAAAKLKIEQQEAYDAYLEQFKAKADELIDAVNRLEQNRQAMLLELLQKNEELVNQNEERVYARLKANLDNVSTNRREITFGLHLSIFVAICCAVSTIISIIRLLLL